MLIPELLSGASRRPLNIAVWISIGLLYVKVKVEFSATLLIFTLLVIGAAAARALTNWGPESSGLKPVVNVREVADTVLPAKSWTPVTFTVYVVLVSSRLEGVSRTTWFP